MLLAPRPSACSGVQGGSEEWRNLFILPLTPQITQATVVAELSELQSMKAVLSENLRYLMQHLWLGGCPVIWGARARGGSCLSSTAHSAGEILSAARTAWPQEVGTAARGFVAKSCPHLRGEMLANSLCRCHLIQGMSCSVLNRRCFPLQS